MQAHLPPLNQDVSRLVLDYLGLPSIRRPDLDFLDRLVTAYTKIVPWESVTRITRRAQLRECDNPQPLDAYPRWPVEFWRQAIEQGGGGTCFESNYAFFSLLLSLGYKGYLTINNMGQSIACHSAIVVELPGQKWLVDVGFPVYSPLPLDAAKSSQRESVFHRYTVRPNHDDSYQVDRDRHPQRSCFTLIDSPIPDETYRGITAADYGPDGLFLERVIITKVIGDTVWRFNSAERPYRLERYKDGHKVEYAIEEEEPGINNLAAAVAKRFNMPPETITFALASVC
jgi:arylamine N-acetyltransferase